MMTPAAIAPGLELPVALKAANKEFMLKHHSPGELVNYGLY